MQNTGLHRPSIQAYYKQGNVFQRDEAYYSQLLNGQRKIPTRFLNSRRQGSRSRGHRDERDASPSRHSQAIVNPNVIINNQSQVVNPINTIVTNQSNVSNNNIFNMILGNQQARPAVQSAQSRQIAQENSKLKVQIEQILNSSDSFGHSNNVVMLRHYAVGGAGSLKLREQEVQIKRLEGILRENQSKISSFKQASQELKVRMYNIQALDKEIYKTLQGSINRDKQLLDRACNGLATGQKREDIVKILQQILST